MRFAYASHEASPAYICAPLAPWVDIASSSVFDGVLPPMALPPARCACGPQSMLAGAEAAYA